MKMIAIVIASFWLGSAAMAQGMMAPAAPSPSVAAGQKCKADNSKLHGAAFNSTVKSCCKKAGAKLKGAALTSFEGSCDKAAMGS
jgi:hypothetical protein